LQSLLLLKPYTHKKTLIYIYIYTQCCQIIEWNLRLVGKKEIHMNTRIELDSSTAILQTFLPLWPSQIQQTTQFSKTQVSKQFKCIANWGLTM
jgi:hypothetical protein